MTFAILPSPLRERMPAEALTHTKAHPYIHVHVEDSWYAKTKEYASFLAGAEALYAALLEGAPEINDGERKALYELVPQRWPSAPYPCADYFVRGAVHRNEQLAPVIAALRVQCEGQRNSNIILAKENEAQSALIEKYKLEVGPPTSYQAELLQENTRLREECELLKRENPDVVQMIDLAKERDNLSKALARAKQFLDDDDIHSKYQLAEIERIARGEAGGEA